MAESPHSIFEQFVCLPEISCFSCFLFFLVYGVIIEVFGKRNSQAFLILFCLLSNFLCCLNVFLVFLLLVFLMFSLFFLDMQKQKRETPGKSPPPIRMSLIAIEASFVYTIGVTLFLCLLRQLLNISD